MRPNSTLPELRMRLDRLDQGAMLGISDPDFEWLFAKKDVPAAPFSTLPRDMIASSAEARARFILESGSLFHPRKHLDSSKVPLLWVLGLQ
jgi:hypothetical protein